MGLCSKYKEFIWALILVLKESISPRRGNMSLGSVQGNLTFGWVTKYGNGAAVHTHACLTHFFCLQKKKQPLLPSMSKAKGHSCRNLQHNSWQNTCKGQRCCKPITDHYSPKTSVVERKLNPMSISRTNRKKMCCFSY